MQRDFFSRDVCMYCNFFSPRNMLFWLTKYASFSAVVVCMYFLQVQVSFQIFFFKIIHPPPCQKSNGPLFIRLYGVLWLANLDNLSVKKRTTVITFQSHQKITTKVREIRFQFIVSLYGFLSFSLWRTSGRTLAGIWVLTALRCCNLFAKCSIPALTLTRVLLARSWRSCESAQLQTNP